MTENDKINAVIEHTVVKDGRKNLSCAAAFKISENTSLSIREIGEICRNENIKIAGCQLGCFK
jgi:hypothetical protein